MKEVWKDIEGYEGIYQVSNLGRVRSLDRKVWNYIKKGRILKSYNNGHGYQNISLHNENKVENKRISYFSNKTYKFIYENKNKILELYDNGNSINEISKQLNINKDNISSILHIFDRI